MTEQLSTSELFARFATMGARLRGHATALEGLAVTGGILTFVVGLVVTFHSRARLPAGHTHPYVGIGIAICAAACLVTMFALVLSRVVDVVGEYVSVAHLVEVTEPSPT